MADDSSSSCGGLQKSDSLEEVFGQLVHREDPERTAHDIAEVAALRA